MKYEKEFEKWFAFMKKWEGGKSKAKTDKASKMTDKPIHTNRGVIFPTWQAVRHLLGKDNSYEAFLAMTEEDHKEIAKWFWYQAGADLYENGNVAAFFAEERWAGGAGALMYYQRRFSQKPDGIIGRKTATAINFFVISSNDNSYWDKLNEMKRERYLSFIAKNPDQKVNERGWFSRIADFYKTFKP